MSRTFLISARALALVFVLAAVATFLADPARAQIEPFPPQATQPPPGTIQTLPSSERDSITTPLGGMYEAIEDREWSGQLLPGSLIYHSYLAGPKESRFASFWAHDENLGWVWDITLGGRVGLWRYGTKGDVQPEGWQFDMEGAAFPRLDLDGERDLVSADYRFGAPLTYGRGPIQTKVAIYHLSSHAGDEFMLTNPTFTRINYSKNVFVWGNSYYVNPATRLYGEIGYGFDVDVAKPWEFQFGLDYSPLSTPGNVAAPFVALNGYLREEVDFGGSFVAQAGWQWRAPCTARRFRVGVEYYNGKSDQFEFFTQNERKVGLGMWYDF